MASQIPAVNNSGLALPPALVLTPPMKETEFAALCPCCDQVVDPACPTCGSPVAREGQRNGGHQVSRVDHYRRFVSLLMTAPNTKFTLQCLTLATGDGFADGLTVSSVARGWRTTEAKVLEQCKEICQRLGIQPSPLLAWKPQNGARNGHVQKHHHLPTPRQTKRVYGQPDASLSEIAALK